MDKISKALKKLSVKERKRIKGLLKRIYAGNFQGISIKKLRSRTDIFRARVGRLRVIYRKKKGGEIFILAIERRSEKTYKKF